MHQNPNASRRVPAIPTLAYLTSQKNENIKVKDNAANPLHAAHYPTLRGSISLPVPTSLIPSIRAIPELCAKKLRDIHRLLHCLCMSLIRQDLPRFRVIGVLVRRCRFATVGRLPLIANYVTQLLVIGCDLCFEKGGIAAVL